MTIDELKGLEAKAVPAPWTPEAWFGSEDPEWVAIGPVHVCRHDDCDGDCSEPGSELEQAAMCDGRLMCALRNLAPELLALWEAANNDGTMRKETWDAVQALNAKGEKLSYKDNEAV